MAASVQPIVILEASLWRSFRKQMCKLNSIEKTAYILGSELWKYDFDDLLNLVNEYVLGV